VEGASDSRPHRIKPRTFDGSGSFETFWAHFENCATYNRWKEADKLAHLKATLIGDAGQVLWDSESSATNTLEKLTQLLRSRFSATRQADKHRMELKLRRRRPGETLSALHQDIHRLMALAHPTLSQDARETIACDYYIDAMDDADFALKIRERAPTTLDEALRIALQLEAWQRDVRRSRPDDYNQLKPKARGAAQAAAVEPSFETQFTQLNQRIDELTRIVQAVATTRPSTTNVTTSTRSTMEGAAMSSNGNKAVVAEQADKAQGGALPTWQRSWSRQPRAARQPTNVCWYCGQTGHFRRECKQRAPATTETQGAITRGGRGLDRALVYVRMNIGDKAVPCLLDSGCEVTLIPKAVAEATRDIEVQPTNHRIWAANGTEVEVTGETKVALKLDGRRIETFALVSPDVEEVMLGADWLQTHNCLWDFGNGKLYIDGRAAVPLSRKRSLCCRRVYVQEELILPPKQQVNVVARSTLCTPSRVVADSWVIESRQLRSGLYVGRTLLPSTHRDLLVRMINTTSEPQLLPINTCLGNLAPVEVLEGTASMLPATCGEQAATEKREQLAPINEAASVATGTEAAKSTEEIVEVLTSKLPGDLTADQQLSVRQLLMQYDDIFSRGAYDMGRTSLVEHSIDTGDHRPIRQGLRRHPMAHLTMIDEQVNEMLQNDLVEPAASPWASNVVLVRKKDGSMRLCVDYRALNGATYKDSYPLPHIDTCLGSMDGAVWFSTLDLRSGYHNIPIKEADRDKTAFITRRGCFRYKVMPFGLTSAPSVFQRLMDLVLCGLTYESCLVFLDDIIVFSRDFQTHTERLREVFNRLRGANLKLHPSKCFLFQKRVAFLGHVLSAAGIEVQSDKVACVRDWPRPTNLTELRAFLGTCSYYRRFIVGFADLAAPLHVLQRKHVPFEWTSKQEEAFNRLKEKLISAPVLGMPMDDGLFYLDSDASEFALGAVLSQIQNGSEVVIAYASRVLSKAERNYDVTKKELLGAVNGLKSFKQYLMGRHFVLRTDHAALQWLRRTPEPMAQLARWLTFIELFDFDIQHRAGTRHGNADGLSRIPIAIDSGNGMARSTVQNQDLSAAAAPESRADTSRDTNSHLEGAVEPDAEPLVVLAETPSSSLSAEASVFIPRWARVATLLEAADEVRPVDSNNDDTVVSVSAGEQLQAEQLQDADIGPVLRLRLQRAEAPSINELLPESEATKIIWSQWQQLELHDGKLYRRRIGKEGRSDTLQLLVPASIKEDYMRQAHSGMCGGHLGLRRTLDQIQRRAFWVGWRRDVKRFCRNCPSCNGYFRGKLPRSAPLQPLLTGAPFERLHVDLTGPHPRSRRGSVYIVTCIDPFTKWAEAFPAPNKEAATVARIIVEQIFCRYGVPIALLTDRGKEVDGQLMAEVCRLLDIDKQRTTAYKASTNAAIERFHRTLNSMIGRMIDENQRDWDSLLPYVMAAYRSSKHETTQYSPNYLMLGREVRAPVDVVYGSSETPAATASDNYAEELDNRLQRAYRLVREHLKVAAERNKKYYDLRVRPQTYNVGDWVYYFNPRKFVGRQDKWCRKFSGPYLVVKLLGPVNVLLQRTKRAKPFAVHIDKVKPYQADNAPSSWLTDCVNGASVPEAVTEAAVTPSAAASLGGGSAAVQRNAADAPSRQPEEPTTTAIPGVPPVSYYQPRPQRHAGRPLRFND
jgi:predicted aspartyl protease/transposase InsO family protein